jgi:hypothetical protein
MVEQTRAQDGASGLRLEDAGNPPGCDNLQFLPKVGVHPSAGIQPVEGTEFGDDGSLYMASFNNLTIAAVLGPDEQEFSVQLPVELFGVGSIDLASGQPIVVTSVQTSVALAGQIVMTQKNDGTRFTLGVVICPVGVT